MFSLLYRKCSSLWGDHFKFLIDLFIDSGKTVISEATFLIIFKEIGIKWFIFAKNIISEIKVGFPLVINFIMDFVLAGIDRFIIAIFLSISLKFAKPVLNNIGCFNFII